MKPASGSGYTEIVDRVNVWWTFKDDTAVSKKKLEQNKKRNAT